MITLYVRTVCTRKGSGKTSCGVTSRQNQFISRPLRSDNKIELLSKCSSKQISLIQRRSVVTILS